MLSQLLNLKGKAIIFTGSVVCGSLPIQIFQTQMSKEIFLMMIVFFTKNIVYSLSDSKDFIITQFIQQGETKQGIEVQCRNLQ